MKLNPPASSSDLETARQIAQRLHQNRRRDDPAAATSWSSEEAPRPRLTPPPLPSRPAPAEHFEPPPARAESVAPRQAEPPLRPGAPPRPEPAPVRQARVEAEPPEPSFDLPEAPPFERPSWSSTEEEEVDVPGLEQPEPVPLEDLASPEEPAAFTPEEPQFEAAPDLPDVDIDEPALSPEEMVGESAEDESSPFDQLTEGEPEASPFDDALLNAPAVAEEPAPPSWDDIVESCMRLAQAKGAMLIDPAGQVFASRGDWPAPGPDAIARKLVTMMAKTLKDAPTRSISAPLMGMYLTAWRVPLSEGLVTAAFIGAAPLRAEARPAIDSEILSGVGS